MAPSPHWIQMSWATGRVVTSRFSETPNALEFFAVSATAKPGLLLWNLTAPRSAIGPWPK